MKRIIGWALDRGEREALLQRFEPVYPEVVADHVTLESGVSPHVRLPTAQSGRIVGHVDDGKGVQAMVVEIDGTTDRPDGSTYHITWSLGPGRRARESNDVLRPRKWTPVSPPVPIRLEPWEYRR